jgi:type 1 glutamine amidotransferase
MAVEVAAPGHPLVAGLADFTIVDERYSDLDCGSDPLAPLTGGRRPPLLWGARTGTAGSCTTLSATTRVLRRSEHREIVRRAIRWASGADGGETA